MGKDVSERKTRGIAGTVMEPMTMARWHLLRALEYTSRDHVAEVTKIGASTLANIQYGLCDVVQNGSTRKIKDLADRLAKSNENVNPWTEFMEDEDTRIEIAQMRAKNPALKKIRVRKEAGHKRKASR